MKTKIKGYLKKLIKILSQPEMRILPSSFAFYVILAIIPLMTIVVLIASSFNISIELVGNLVSDVMPKQVSNIIIDVISGKGFDTHIGFFNVVAFVIASNGTYAIINMSNTLYKIKDRDVLKDRISSVILLFIIIILFVFMLILPIFGENILNLMNRASIMSQYSDEVMGIFNAFKWPITILIIYLNIKLLYTMAPSKNIKSEETTYGALFTTGAWVIATVIFRFYLAYFARYDIIYGSLSSIIIMMAWVYALSYIFVLGMAINASRREEQELYETQRLELERLKEINNKKEGTSKKK